MTGARGAIDWMELPSLHLIRRIEMPNTETGAPLTREGMTIFKGEVWLLPEDGTSRLFVFPADIH